MSNDPLLQPYQLKHLTLKNRIMSTAHEPTYSEDGLPKERYRLYHQEKAQGRYRADDDRRIRGGVARQPRGVRQPACLPRRDRAVAGASWPTPATSTAAR